MKLKIVKISSEILSLKQSGERKAYGLDSMEMTRFYAKGNTAPVETLTEDQLDAIIARLRSEGGYREAEEG